MISLLLAKVQCEVEHSLVNGCAEINQQVLESFSGLQIHRCDRYFFKMEKNSNFIENITLEWNL
jgi:hypothetical protein